MELNLNKQELKENFNLATEACNIYELALQLATKDITKFLSQYSLLKPDEIKDYYILQAQKRMAMKNEEIRGRNNGRI